MDRERGDWPLGTRVAEEKGWGGREEEREGGRKREGEMGGW